MNEFKNKRILLLGGTNCVEDLLMFQRQTGVNYIVTTDTRHMDSKLRDIAQERYLISPLDKDGLVELIEEKKIDALFGGSNEDIVVVAMKVAERCGLPYYVTQKQWEITANKDNFKKKCREYGIPVVQEYTEETVRTCKNKEFFPVIIKPVDACGSRGVVLCEGIESFEEKKAIAEAESKLKRILIEKYLKGTELVAYYTLDDGNISLSSVCDRHNANDSEGLDSLPDAFQYPSKYTKLFVEKYDKRFRKMLIEGLGLKNGVLGVQGFACDGELSFFEMGYRLGGTSQYRYTKALNGISNFESMLAFAITGKMNYYPLRLDNALFCKPCCTLTILLRPGIIGKVYGVDEVKRLKQVICLEEHYKVGDKVIETHSLSQMMFWIFIIGETDEDIKSVIRTVKEKLVVKDANDHNMILSDFNPDRLDYNYV